MPYCTLDDKKIYFEALGEGEPVVLLNGIMMSTESWSSFKEIFTKRNKLVLIDFFDQGRSDKLNEEYSQEVQVKALERVLDELDIQKANIVGVSYGGEVAQQFAINHKNRIRSLVLANTTSYTNALLKDVGDAWAEAAKSYDGHAFFKATMPFIYSKSFYEDNLSWLKAREELFNKALDKEWYEGFIRLVHSAESFDTRESLNAIEAKTLIIASENDLTTPLEEQIALQNGIKDSLLVEIKGSGHASMYEKPMEFASLVLGFINNIDTQIKIM